MARQPKHHRNAVKEFRQLQAEHSKAHIDREHSFSLFLIQKVDAGAGETKFVFTDRFLNSSQLLKCDALLDLLNLVEAAYAAALCEYEAKLVRLGARPDRSRDPDFVLRPTQPRGLSMTKNDEPETGTASEQPETPAVNAEAAESAAPEAGTTEVPTEAPTTETPTEEPQGDAAA